MHVQATLNVRRLEDNLWKLTLPFYNVSPGVKPESPASVVRIWQHTPLLAESLHQLRANSSGKS